MNKATEIKLVRIEDLKPSPNNPNVHTKEQLDRLKKIIEYQGFRNPVIVSNLSGCIVAGHGRTKAAEMAGLTQVPVIFQDFDDEAQEYAAIVSDNAIASWADLDLSMINEAIGDFGPDFIDIDLLGIKGFTLFPEDDNKPADEEKKTEVETERCTLCGNKVKKE